MQDGYAFDKSPSEQEEKYDACAMTDDLYALIVDYYNNNTDDEMKVKCYTKDADCDSEEDEQINLCLGFMSFKFVCLQGAASVALLSSSSTLVPHTGPAMKRRVSNRSRQRNSFISSLSS